MLPEAKGCRGLAAKGLTKIISWRNRNDVTSIHAVEQGCKRFKKDCLGQIGDAVVEASQLWNHHTRAVQSPLMSIWPNRVRKLNIWW